MNNLRSTVEVPQHESGADAYGSDTLMDWHTFTTHAEDIKPEKEREDLWMQ